MGSSLPPSELSNYPYYSSKLITSTVFRDQRPMQTAAYRHPSQHRSFSNEGYNYLRDSYWSPNRDISMHTSLAGDGYHSGFAGDLDAFDSVPMPDYMHNMPSDHSQPASAGQLTNYHDLPLHVSTGPSWSLSHVPHSGHHNAATGDPVQADYLSNPHLQNSQAVFSHSNLHSSYPDDPSVSLQTPATEYLVSNTYAHSLSPNSTHTTYPSYSGPVFQGAVHSDALNLPSTCGSHPSQTSNPSPITRSSSASSYKSATDAQGQPPRKNAVTICQWDGCGQQLHDDSCAGVRRHLKDHHFRGKQPLQKDRISCRWGPSCKREAMQWENIPKHVAECHIGSMKRFCTKCGDGFARSDTLKRHSDSGGCTRGLTQM